MLNLMTLSLSCNHGATEQAMPVYYMKMPENKFRRAGWICGLLTHRRGLSCSVKPAADE